MDGSPDGSLVLLRRLLAEQASFASQLIALSRNFGSFSAVRTGPRGRRRRARRGDGGRPPGAGLARARVLRDARDGGVRRRRGSAQLESGRPRRPVRDPGCSGGSTGISCNGRSRRAASTCSGAHGRSRTSSSAWTSRTPASSGSSTGSASGGSRSSTTACRGPRARARGASDARCVTSWTASTPSPTCRSHSSSRWASSASS